MEPSTEAKLRKARILRLHEAGHVYLIINGVGVTTGHLALHNLDAAMDYLATQGKVLLCTDPEGTLFTVASATRPRPRRGRSPNRPPHPPHGESYASPRPPRPRLQSHLPWRLLKPFAARTSKSSFVEAALVTWAVTSARQKGVSMGTRKGINGCSAVEHVFRHESCRFLAGDTAREVWLLDHFASLARPDPARVVETNSSIDTL